MALIWWIILGLSVLGIIIWLSVKYGCGCDDCGDCDFDGVDFGGGDSGGSDGGGGD